MDKVYLLVQMEWEEGPTVLEVFKDLHKAEGRAKAMMKESGGRMTPDGWYGLKWGLARDVDDPTHVGHDWIIWLWIDTKKITQ